MGVAADKLGVTGKDLEIFDKLRDETEIYSLTEKERACLINHVDGNTTNVESLSHRELWNEAHGVSFQIEVDSNHELIKALAEAVEPGLSSSLSPDFVFEDGTAESGTVYSGSSFVSFLGPRGFLPLSETKLAELETVESSLGHRPHGTLLAPCDIDVVRVAIDGALHQNTEYHDAAAITAAVYELIEPLK